MRPLHVSRHPPTITNRVEFVRVKILPRPDITARVNYAGKWAIDPMPLSPCLAMTGLDPELESCPDSNDDDEENIDELCNENNDTNVDKGPRMIPKPQGERGRPRSGGYTLSKVLEGWDGDLKVISAFVKSEADKALDMTLSYKNQPQTGIDAICELVQTTLTVSFRKIELFIGISSLPDFAQL
ncbi:hypothetical protein CVT26_010512 [Gymnopilus dilepis]|uniref:Uncharacterized protein n=1 Tax=Gymnopilus dilepis TaxID=231916 RepID=A0A409Y0A4_9AGAR|nr:hypothetical protein CVT26_010512 [Gymnopilus dilepis]